jgi:hypothetical protein
LKLAFDHIGLPNDLVPVPAKIIAARGFKVDKQGKIIGHGHPTRDLAEWMVPPLWPVKVLTLPRRGPRPTLKGEEPLTLRLMDDVAIPVQSAWHPFGTSSMEDWPQWNQPAPRRSIAPQVPTSARPSPANDGQAAKVVVSSGTSTPSATQNVLVLRNGTSCLATSLRVDGNRLSYTRADGSSSVVSLDEVDWTKTFQSNSENGTVLAMTN